MQNLVRDFITKYNLQTDKTVRYIDLTSEIGELGKEILKSTDYGKKDFILNDKAIEEIGDCIFSLLALTEIMGIDGEDALLKVLCKYESRFSQKGNISSD